LRKEGQKGKTARGSQVKNVKDERESPNKTQREGGRGGVDKSEVGAREDTGVGFEDGKKRTQTGEEGMQGGSWGVGRDGNGEEVGGRFLKKEGGRGVLFRGSAVVRLGKGLEATEKVGLGPKVAASQWGQATKKVRGWVEKKEGVVGGCGYWMWWCCKWGQPEKKMGGGSTGAGHRGKCVG